MVGDSSAQNGLSAAAEPLEITGDASPFGNAAAAASPFAFSRDGMRWSPLVPLLATKPIGPRTADHPAIGIFSDGDNVLVYVQTNVPGIATQGASRLRRYAIPFAVFKATSTRALLD